MNRKFQPTEKQLEKWEKLSPAAKPTDDEFKAAWARKHHNVERGWGMGKRQWVIEHADDALTCCADYFLGLWEGRIDAMNGTAPSSTEQYHTDPFQHGYYTGYHTFQSFWKGFDQAARAQFQAQYGI